MSDSKFNKFEQYVIDHPELQDKINDGIMAPKFNDIKSIYIDLALLKDTRMGLMIGLCKQRNDDNQLEYLLDHLDDYNKFPDAKFTTVYPEFMYNETQLTKLYESGNCTDLCFKYAPDTTFLNYLTLELDQILRQNDRADYKNPITIMLNTYPLNVTKEIQLYAKGLEAYYRHRVAITLINRNYNSLGNEFWMLQQFIFTNDIRKLVVENKLMRKAICEDYKYLNTRIVSQPVADDNIIKEWVKQGINILDEKEIEDAFFPTIFILSACCIFSFKNFYIPIPKKDE